MPKKRFWILLGVEILVIGGVAAYFLIDSADIYKLIAGNTKFYAPEQPCDLHVQPCSIKVGDIATVTLDIQPPDIPLMQTLEFEVTLSRELSLDSLGLAIYATNMNMGYNTFTLKKVAPKKYIARGMLPTCIVGGMKWNAEISIDQPTQSNGALFKFQTK